MKKKNLRERIKETKHFKSLSKMLQNLTLKSNNVNHIQHALDVIENTSFDNWIAISEYRYNNFQIIKELAEN